MEIRLVTNHELKQAVQLADDVFRKPGQSSMGTSFPFLFAPGLSHSYGAFDEGRLVSFMGLVPFVIHTGGARLNVFSMGAVCTHPDYRGQGIAGQLLDRCKQHVDEAGASLLFISGDRSLYTRVHCYPFGSTEHFTLDTEGAVRLKAAVSALLTGDSPIESRSFQLADLFALQATAADRKVAYEQSVTDLGLMIEAEAYASCLRLEHRTLVAAGEASSVDSFAVIAAPGHSADSKPPITIEWAGPAAHVGTLIANAVEQLNLTQLKIPVCWHEQKLIELLREASVPSETKANNGTVYIVNAQRVLDQAFPGSNKDQQQAFMVNSMEDGTYKVKTGDTSLVITPSELVTLLFDPSSLHKPLLPGWSTIPLPLTNGLNYI
ncbi:Acetyltransferase (GNAT) domain-containing protein [Paenibacillus sp. 1_12]|uniref:GNAT family N-acetyltransferase n=1 Tax=Paenibacillus sp. 1_12 TaxID=1566278 RepID=UPI0008EB3440|nr:GNAT family N-acetyltransferase [Paenibacillus sp. 1_12]SFL54599.1 Acetyltransferase (GNAT) domain-containing protein [Paenibacillus sp. 1_12]